MLFSKIEDIFKEFPHVIFGFSNINFSEYSNKYKCALIFAVPYTYMMTLETYNEKIFQKGIDDAQKVINYLIRQLEITFKKENIKYFVPSTAQKNEEELIAPFSFKFAAVNAGLGWIGKNDVLITAKYGPRQRLSAVLIDYDFPVGKPIIKSRCPEKCTRCIDICPHKALKGITWNINSKRKDIIDYHLCNKKRSAFIKKLGRKNSCGLCLVRCPIGTNELPH